MGPPSSVMSQVVRDGLTFASSGHASEHKRTPAGGWQRPPGCAVLCATAPGEAPGNGG